jgi:endoglucanase
MAKRRALVFLSWILVIDWCTNGQAAEAANDAVALCRSIGRGVNLGNALEAPREGAWGFSLKAEYFPLIKQVGFDSVRIPVRWSAHAKHEPPYTIDSEFFARVDWALDQAAKNDLVAILNVHHYDELYPNPDEHLPRLKGLWEQIAARYRDRSERVLFELLNEPNARLDDRKWNAAIPELLAIIRKNNPTRGVIVGPANWNNVNELEKLALPESDRWLIATFHYYEPFQFTHQGASWAKGSDAWRGKTWTASTEELTRLRADFDKAAAWGKRHNLPIFLGEFGAYSAADMDSRARWTAVVVHEAEARGFAWAYWEFGSGFGVYDPQRQAWREPLLKSLLAPR